MYFGNNKYSFKFRKHTPDAAKLLNAFAKCAKYVKNTMPGGANDKYEKIITAMCDKRIKKLYRTSAGSRHQRSANIAHNNRLASTQITSRYSSIAKELHPGCDEFWFLPGKQ